MTTIPDDMVERVAWALHDKMVEQDVYGYLGAKIDAAELARTAIEEMQPAILAERERCAKVADRWKHHDTGYDIAAAIRSQS